MFRIDGQPAAEISGAAMALDKPLQTLVEHNMERLFGVRLIASEYSTGRSTPTGLIRSDSTRTAAP